ncbi:helix-turn-helix transcriptional regulator [Cryptosporangium japonicum]|uniref:Response regulator transcription factor n=1 Tax=Cryptosporangium japonicum TaxID=80872 RepID=A0ABN0U909_9ACTN
MSVGSLATNPGRSRRDPGRVPVTVHCEDPLTRAGLLSHLRTEPLVDLRDGSVPPVAGGVAVVLADRVEDLTVARVRRLTPVQRVVLVVGQLREPELLRALDCRVAAILLRDQVTPGRLASAVRTAARGDRDLPSDLVGRLVEVVHRLRRQAEGSVAASVTHPPTARELDVLRLLAEGWETRAVARELAYSERTVKTVLQGLTSRFELRNRTHAVAYAFREGYL